MGRGAERLNNGNKKVQGEERTGYPAERERSFSKLERAEQNKKQSGDNVDDGEDGMPIRRNTNNWPMTVSTQVPTHNNFRKVFTP
jgi:hypothetical protein